jgi:hypothetical protein
LINSSTHNTLHTNCQPCREASPVTWKEKSLLDPNHQSKVQDDLERNNTKGELTRLAGGNGWMVGILKSENTTTYATLFTNL